jgi:hypothetical protein
MIFPTDDDDAKEKSVCKASVFNGDNLDAIVMPKRIGNSSI